MAVPLLDLKRQYLEIAEEIRRGIDEVVEHQSFILGEQVERLEGEVAQLLGVSAAIGVASGTDALLLPLRTLDLKPSDEVITSPFTFFATAGAIHNAGARPVFADIDRHTFNIDPDAVAAAITPRTRGIVAVHLFGQMAPMERLRDIADQHGLFLLEDAAQAIGAQQKVNGSWKSTGHLGDAAAFSFFPSKNLGGFGDGGMVVVDRNRHLAARIRRLRVHGGIKMYHHEEVGTNSRLDALQAAVLRAKLPHLQRWNTQRIANACWYDERLRLLEERGVLKRPVVAPGNRAVYNQYTLRAERRDDLRTALAEKGVGAAVYYPVPLHLQPCFSYLGYGRGAFPEAESASKEVLSIPIFPELREHELESVASAVERFYS